MYDGFSLTLKTEFALNRTLKNNLGFTDLRLMIMQVVINELSIFFYHLLSFKPLSKYKQDLRGCFVCDKDESGL